MDMAIKERKVIDIESPSCWGEFNLPYCTIRVSPPLFAIVQTNRSNPNIRQRGLFAILLNNNPPFEHDASA